GWRALVRWHVPTAAVGAAAGLALAVSTVLTVRDYFVVWGSGPLAYHAMMADKSDSAAYLAGLARTDRVFLAPLYAQDNTIRFLTRDVRIDSFDLGKSLVVPTSRARPVHYVFPSSDAAEAAQVARELPAGVTVATVLDPSGRFPLLTSLDLPSAALPPAPTERIATFQDAIVLSHAEVGPSPAKPGGTLSVTFEWLALGPVPESYTVFLHLRDAANHTVAQVDRQPTDGSFPTASWQTGDLVQDRH